MPFVGINTQIFVSIMQKKSTRKLSRHNVQSITTKKLLVLFGTPKNNKSKFEPPKKTSPSQCTKEILEWDTDAATCRTLHKTEGDMNRQLVLDT
jgi:hypothetical protein